MAKPLYQWASEVGADYHAARRDFLRTGQVYYPWSHPRRGEAVPAWQRRKGTTIYVADDPSAVEDARRLLEAQGWTCIPPERNSADT